MWWHHVIVTTHPKFFIYRNSNKQLVAKAMNNIDWEPNDSTKDLSKTDAPTMRQLAGMQLVARMKEAADKAGAGFVGGFVTPTGQRFMMSNVDADDVQFQAINQELESIQNKNAKDNGSFFDSFQNTVKIIESEEGIQLKIEPEAE